MRKALIYGLTLTFALTLTACGQPRAEEPGAPDPAASAAVQTASPEETTKPTATPEPSEETPTAPAETDTQPAEDTAPEEIPAEEDPEDPGETVTTQPTEETETERDGVWGAVWERREVVCGVQCWRGRRWRVELN